MVVEADFSAGDAGQNDEGNGGHEWRHWNDDGGTLAVVAVDWWRRWRGAQLLFLVTTLTHVRSLSAGPSMTTVGELQGSDGDGGTGRDGSFSSAVASSQQRRPWRHGGDAAKVPSSLGSRAVFPSSLNSDDDILFVGNNDGGDGEAGWTWCSSVHKVWVCDRRGVG